MLFLARWDGRAWIPLADFISSGVNALAVFGTELIVGGAFSYVAGQLVNEIAAWNGASWRGFGRAPDHVVRSFAVHEDELIAGGDYHFAGSIEARGIARWDDYQWHPFGLGFGTKSAPSRVSAMMSFRGDLIAGGRFSLGG